MDRRRREMSRWIASCIVLAAAACQVDSEASIQPIRRDSAGVPIVEHARPDPAERLPWTFGPGPTVDIGSLDGDEAYQRFSVGHALRLDDGRIVVADGGSGEIRVFGPAGRHLHTWGGQGEGPGEFAFPTRIGPWPGDSLAVWDRRLRRLSLLAPAGSFVRTLDLTLVPRGGLLDWIGSFADGVSVFTHQDILAKPPADGLRRHPLTAVLLDPDGERVAALPTLPGEEVLIRVGDGTIHAMRIPFSRSFVAATVGGRVVLGPNDTFELRLFGRAGDLERIVRLDAPTRPVTEADVEAEVERQVEAAPEQFQAGMRAGLEDAPRPETFPAIDQVLSDPSGHMWVRTYHPPAEGRLPAVWSVLDGEGALLGRVETPPGLTLLQIGRDFVLGHRTDELDVEHIQTWPLARPQA